MRKRDKNKELKNKELRKIRQELHLSASTLSVYDLKDFYDNFTQIKKMLSEPGIIPWLYGKYAINPDEDLLELINLIKQHGEKWKNIINSIEGIDDLKKHDMQSILDNAHFLKYTATLMAISQPQISKFVSLGIDVIIFLRDTSDSTQIQDFFSDPDMKNWLYGKCLETEGYGRKELVTLLKFVERNHERLPPAVKNQFDNENDRLILVGVFKLLKPVIDEMKLEKEKQQDSYKSTVNDGKAFITGTEALKITLNKEQFKDITLWLTNQFFSPARTQDQKEKIANLNDLLLGETKDALTSLVDNKNIEESFNKWNALLKTKGFPEDIETLQWVIGEIKNPHPATYTPSKVDYDPYSGIPPATKQDEDEGEGEDEDEDVKKNASSGSRP